MPLSNHNRPFIHILFGNGRGKTSAAAGTLLRCWNYHPVPRDYYWVQFLKQGSAYSGETHLIQENLSIPVFTVNPDISLQNYNTLSPSLQDTLRKQVEDFRTMSDRIFTGTYRLVVFDEILDALTHVKWDIQELIEWLIHFPAEDLILTGHTSIPELFQNADYITEFIGHRHPRSKGTAPRKGLEF